MSNFIEKKRSLFFGLPLSFTTYIIGDELLTTKEGLVRTVENDCYLYKIQDVTLTRGLMQKMFGLSTIVCHTGDTTNPQLELKNIKNGQEIKDYLVKKSDDERLRRRTVNTLNISADDMDDEFDMEE